jgi:hypothetical protein
MECDNQSDTESLISSISSDWSSIIEDFDIQESLREWACTYNISHSSLQALLLILKNVDSSLPMDPRTLLKTPQNLTLIPVFPGYYFHFGLIDGIKFVLQSSGSCGHAFDLQLNVDGVPLFQSTTKGFWVILGRIVQIENSVFVIGIYYGANKPESAEIFLNKTIQEIKILEEGLLHVGSSDITISLTSVCCDTPARCFVKCIKSYTGHYGCDRCVQKGHYAGRLVFLESDANVRTDDSFRDRNQPEHHHAFSPFEYTHVDMVLSFPNDYMHSVCKGVGVKLLSAFKSGAIPNRLSSSQLSQLDAELLKVCEQIPVEFSRKPRSLTVLKMWKATEVRLFIVYLGPAILPSIFSNSQQNLLKAFMCFFAATFLMGHPVLCKTWAPTIRNWVSTFIEQCKYLYGDEFVTYNVHSLVHLANDCSRLGCFDEFSCFPFENFLRFVKKTVRSSVLPLNQTVKRIYESDVCLGQMGNLPEETFKFIHQRTHGVIPSNFTMDDDAVLFYDGIKLGAFSLIANGKDGFFSVENEIYKLSNAILVEDKKLLVCQKFFAKEDFFTYPIPSSQLGIYSLKDLRKKLFVIPVETVTCKMFIIWTHGKCYASPILHTKPF